MNKDKKRITTNAAMKVATIKSNMRNSINPFDGSGVWFNKALSELRKEGVNIVFDRKMHRYYNPVTIKQSWGYNT